MPEILTPESLAAVCLALDGDDWLDAKTEFVPGDLRERIAQAIRDAERRGFERAKRAAAACCGFDVYNLGNCIRAEILALEDKP